MIPSRNQPPDPRRAFWTSLCALALMAAALVNATVRSGGLDPLGWDTSLVLIAGAMLLLWFLTPAENLAPRLPRSLGWLACAFAVWLLLQIAPLPIHWLASISPSRAAFLAPFSAVAPDVRWGTLSLAPQATVIHIARLLGYLMVLLTARQLAWRMQGRIWMLAAPILWLGAIEAVLGFMQYAADPGHATATGTYLNRNHFAGLLEMTMPFLAVSAWKILQQRFRSGAPISLWASIRLGTLVLVAGAILVAELRSLSRLGPLSMVVSLLVVAALELPSGWSPRSIFGALLVCASLGLAAMALVAPHRLWSRYATAADSNIYDVRQLIWKDTLHMVEDYPVTGVGWGAFEAAYPRYERISPTLPIVAAHNDYLQWLAELGLPGFLILAALLVLFLRESFAASLTNSRADPPETHEYALACMGALTAILLHSAGDYHFYVPANAMTFAWIAGVGAGLHPRLRQVMVPAVSYQPSAFSLVPRSEPPIVEWSSPDTDH